MVKRSHEADAVWTERLLLILVTAVTLAAVDQWVKVALATPAWALHHRSATWFFGSCFLLVAALPLVCRRKASPSRRGIFCGGVLGNLLSASSNALYVPNPIVIGNMTGGVAFNVADTFIVSGNLMLMLALITVTLRYRDRFARHAFERAIWRRVRELPSRW